jgi:hypothetical protein
MLFVDRLIKVLLPHTQKLDISSSLKNAILKKAETLYDPVTIARHIRYFNMGRRFLTFRHCGTSMIQVIPYDSGLNNRAPIVDSAICPKCLYGYALIHDN